MLIDEKEADQRALNGEYLDLRGLALYSSLGVSTLRLHLKNGLVHFKVGGKILIRKTDFDRYIVKFRIDPKESLGEIVDAAVQAVSGKKIGNLES